MKNRTIKKLATAMFLCAGMAIAATASAATPISAHEWDISGTASQGQGTDWLTLAASRPYQVGSVQSKTAYGPNENLKIEFDYVSWGGTGADGLAVYLFNADANNAGASGADGGALGYCGVKGAYVGIGLDQYGTFTDGECKHGKHERMPYTNNTVIRGSEANNYAFQGSYWIDAPLDCMSCTSREQAIGIGFVKRVVVELNSRQTSPAGYTINLWMNGLAVFRGFEYIQDAPRRMKVGISAATGAANNYHEIRNLQVSSSHEECFD